MNKTDISTLRKEQRFFVHDTQAVPLLSLFKEADLVVEQYSNNTVHQTVYLIDDEQTNTMGVSLKARRYIENHSQILCLNSIMSGIYNFEIKKAFNKSGSGINCKEKTCDIGLDKILELVRKTSAEIRPYFVTEYRRQHFVFSEDKTLGCRITLDTEMRYWFFPSGQTNAVLLRDFKQPENIIRIEIKLDPQKEPADSIINLIERIKHLGAHPITSKKHDILNAIKWFFDQSNCSPMVKELSECEIESKLNVSMPFDPDAFFVALKHFLKTKTAPILLDSRYPFTMTTSSTNHYWEKCVDDNCSPDVIKILSRGLRARPVFKSNTELLDEDNCILKRKEIKGERFSLLEKTFRDVICQNEQQLEEIRYAGFLFRIRKAVWLVNETTGRIYHVSLDKCTSHRKMPLYQIEVEYSGRLITHNNTPTDPFEVEKEIIKETAFLTEKIILFAKEKGITLSPGQEKFQWLTNQ